MKIVVTDWSTMSAAESLDLSALEAFGEVVCCGLTDPGKAAEAIGDADAVLVNKTPITNAVMDACPNLKYIGLFATGYNNIDIPASRAHGITVCNAGQYSTNGVIQHTFALLLSLAENLPRYEQAVRDGEWERSETFSYFPYPIRELAGKTMAIIGYGSIGQGVARVADAFGMRVIVNTRTAPKNCPFEVVSQDEAFRQADVLSVHCPLTEQTANLLRKETLSLMKPTAFVINTARGGIADEAAVAEALQNGMIAGYGTDVLVKEPMSPDTPLKNAPNCIITPHIAWSALETRERLVSIVADNLRNWLEGHPTNQVN